MSEPDELYTLRAQFWLGHYQLALEEARSVARRPMSPALKDEREELLARANIALGNYDSVSGGGGSTPGKGSIKRSKQTKGPDESILLIFKLTSLSLQLQHCKPSR
jgi:hypothetical protein